MYILIDMDGPLFGFEAGFRAALAREHPQIPAVGRDGRRNFKVADDYPPEHTDAIEELMLAKGFYRDLPPVEGAAEALNAMLLEGHEAYICTAPMVESKYCAGEKIAAIRQHFGRTWVKRTIITRDKTMVHGDYLIDDKPEITGSHVPSWRHVVYDETYNRHVGGLRLTDWRQWRTALGLPSPAASTCS